MEVLLGYHITVKMVLKYTGKMVYRYTSIMV